MLSKQSDGIKEAVFTLKELSEDEKIQLQCEAREMYEHDLASAIDCGRREGLFDTARNMIKNGSTIDYVMKCTGLSENDIQKLL